MPRATVSQQQLEGHLRGTPLQGSAGSFIRWGRQYQVDPRLLVSIASAESSLGKHAQGHNPFGWGPGIHFSSWDEAISTVAKGLRQNYLGKGLRTIEQIGSKYAPQHVANDPTGLNSNWVKNVRAMYQTLGGVGPIGTGGTSPNPRPAGPSPPDLRAFVSQSIAGDPTQGGRAYKPTEVLNNLVQLIRSSPVANVQQASKQLGGLEIQGPVSVRDRKAVSLVQQYLGDPYVWGGSRPGAFDCSGLLQYVWGKVGVKIPRTTFDQINAGRAVAKNQLRPGDAVFFGTRANPHHVGMFIGHGKFVEAPHTGANVRIATLAGRGDFLTARRFA